MIGEPHGCVVMAASSPCIAITKNDFGPSHRELEAGKECQSHLMEGYCWLSFLWLTFTAHPAVYIIDQTYPLVVSPDQALSATPCQRVLRGRDKAKL